MFDDPDKVKEFIIWCQQNKVKSFKNDKMEFHLSDFAFLPETEHHKEIPLNDEKTFADFDNLSPEEADELLYWSSGKPTQKG